MPFTNKRFIAILGILPFPIIKHISVNSQRTGYLWGFLALFGNHFNRLNLKRLVKPLHFDAFPNHWTPPILRAGFYANTNSSLCPLFRGKITVYPTTVINWIKEGILPAYTTPGGHRRIRKEDLLNLLNKNNMPIPEELTKGAKFRVL